MSYTAQEIVNSALALTDTVQNDFSTANIIIWMNSLQRKVSTFIDDNDTETTQTTVAATNSYTLPTDLWKIKRIEYEGKKATWVSFDEYQNFVDDALTPDDAAIYTVWGGNLLIYTGATIVVSKTITYYYFSNPTDITALSSSVDIPNHYIDAATSWLAGKFLQAIDEPGLANNMFSEHQSAMFEAKRQDLKNKREDPIRVKTLVYDKYDVHDQ